MTVLLERQAAIGIKVEATEGTAETLTAAEAIILPYDAKFKPDVRMYARTPHRAKVTPLKKIPGRKLGRITFRSEFKGSSGVTTPPEWDVFASIATLVRSAISSATIGAITNGPFQGGETAALAPSGAVVRIAGDHVTGDTHLHYVVVSGVPANGDGVTGATSGATATLTGVPSAAQGYEWRPSSTTTPSATVALWRDGKRHTLVGARATVRIVHVADEPVMLEWDVLGVWTGSIDEAIPASIAYQEITPASWEAVTLTVHSYSAELERLTVDMGVVLEPRPSANAAHGVRSVQFVTRAVTGEVDPEDSLVSEHDWLGRMRAGTTGRLAYRFGSGAAQRLRVACPCVQYSDADEQARAGLQVLKIPLEFVSPTIQGGDDEIQIVLL